MGQQIVQFRVLRSGESFKLVSFLKTKLWFFKVRKLDVCGHIRISGHDMIYFSISIVEKWRLKH